MAALQASPATKPKTWHVGHEGYADALLTDVNKSCQKTSADEQASCEGAGHYKQTLLFVMAQLGQVASRARLFPS